MQDQLSVLWYDFWYWLYKATATLAFSYRSEGGDRIPRCGPALLVANHESFLDPLLVGMSAYRHLRYLARKTLFKHPLFGAYLRSVGCVPVDQQGVAKEGLKAALDLLHAGEAVLVFPEGERTRTGGMQPLKPGIHLLIKRSQAPVIPVGVAGAYQILPRTRSRPKFCPLISQTPCGGVAVSVGRPLPAERFRDMPREQLLQELFQAIGAARHRAERLRRKPSSSTPQ
jgi:1-acyl-sn-glycerol-3-phosphate acyltransferase